MSELPSYGTGWSESEVLMDALTLYSEWNGESDLDFSTVQRRLREKFTGNELIALAAVVEVLGRFIDDELMQRTGEKHVSVEAPTVRWER